jgi:phage baseplate assembly protein V
MSREFMKLLSPLSRRLRLMASRAVLSLISDASGMQIVQVKLLNGEVRNGIERYQQYGFTSVPLPGAEGIYLSLGADRDHGVIIVADDRRYRIKGLQSGEVAIYTDEDKAAADHRIVFKRGKEIHITAGASSIVMTPTGITITTPSLDIVKV